MPHSVIQSVLQMTEKNSIEALEHNLPKSIAALLPVHSISIYKPVMENDYQEVEEVLKFLVHDYEPRYLWSAESQVQSADVRLQKCFIHSSVEEISEANGNSTIFYPIKIDGKTTKALRIQSDALNEEQRLILDGLTKVYKNYLTILHESECDKLTSLLNRRTFDQRFDKLISIQKHQQRALWEEYELTEKRQLTASDQIFLAMVDIDHFKTVNDTYGHIFGDEILLLVSRIMKKTFRRSDLLFRFGGEEFVILLEPTPIEEVFIVLERFRKEVENYNFPQMGKLTVSIGYTAVQEKNYATTACSNADKALYYAKNNGRNITFCYEKLLAEGELSNSDNSGSIELF